MAESKAWMVDELRKERDRSSLDLPGLTSFLDGGEFVTEKRRKICNNLAVLCALASWLRFFFFFFFM